METAPISNIIKQALIPTLNDIDSGIAATIESQIQLKSQIERLFAESQLLGSTLDQPNIIPVMDKLFVSRKRVLQLQKRLSILSTKLAKLG
ncbi:hypothetical protein BC833DRAFT_585453 [Globomyces pollinis-pini]|nr:hypothetical protein BC833DRAFT_585453 [Globomyces pollinis-pini]KAJ3000059.1 hypothetical protein HDV02_000707 [Globomyces sp. JEL0801]